MSDTAVNYGTSTQFLIIIALCATKWKIGKGNGLPLFQIDTQQKLIYALIIIQVI